MNTFNKKFWLVLMFIALASLLFVGNFATGQVAPVDNNLVVLNGFFMPNRAGDRDVECTPRIHYVDLVAGRTYFIRMNSSEPNTWLSLEDLHGNILASDNELWDEINGSILFRPTVTDRYRIVASARMPIEVGYYTLSVRTLPAMFHEDAVISPAEEWGNRTAEFCLEEGRRYVIEVNSDTFPAVARLINSDGAVVAFDDEGFMVNRTRIIYTAPRSDVYRLEVLSNTPFTGGACRMTVSEF